MTREKINAVNVGDILVFVRGKSEYTADVTLYSISSVFGSPIGHFVANCFYADGRPELGTNFYTNTSHLELIQTHGAFKFIL